MLSTPLFTGALGLVFGFPLALILFGDKIRNSPHEGVVAATAVSCFGASSSERMSVSTSALATRNPQRVTFAGVHGVFADGVDELWLVGVRPDEREWIRGLRRELAGHALEELATLGGCQPANRRQQFVDFQACHDPNLPQGRRADRPRMAWLSVWKRRIETHLTPSPRAEINHAREQQPGRPRRLQLR